MAKAYILVCFMTGILKAANRHGAEGFYPMFRRDKHVTIPFPDNGEYYISIDYGTYNPVFRRTMAVTPGRIIPEKKEYYYSGRKNACPKQTRNIMRIWKNLCR